MKHVKKQRSLDHQFRIFPVQSYFFVETKKLFQCLWDSLTVINADRVILFHPFIKNEGEIFINGFKTCDPESKSRYI